MAFYCRLIIIANRYVQHNLTSLTVAIILHSAVLLNKAVSDSRFGRNSSACAKLSGNMLWYILSGFPELVCCVPAKISPHSLQHHTSPDRREFSEISSFSFHSPHHRKLKTAKKRACSVSLFMGQYCNFFKTPKISAKKQETFSWFPVLMCRCDRRRLFSFFVWLFIKAELEQGSDKPPFDVVLGVLVDLSVFKGSKPDSLAVMPKTSSTASGSPLVALIMVSYGTSLGFLMEKHLHFFIQHLQGTVYVMPRRTPAASV